MGGTDGWRMGIGEEPGEGEAWSGLQAPHQKGLINLKQRIPNF